MMLNHGESESEVAQSCRTLSDPMVCSLPGSSVHGIFQTRVLEWGAIAFSIYMYIYMFFILYSVYVNLYTNFIYRIKYTVSLQTAYHL